MAEAGVSFYRAALPSKNRLTFHIATGGGLLLKKGFRAQNCEGFFSSRNISVRGSSKRHATGQERIQVSGQPIL